MIKSKKCWSLGVMMISVVCCSYAQQSLANQATNILKVQSVSVDGKQRPFSHGKSVNLGSFPQNVSFGFGETVNSGQGPFRIRHRLEGYENNWSEGGAFMYLAVRFYNEAGEQIGQNIFKVTGDSAGWTGSLKDSPLAHRRETIIVPQQAARVWVVISSAGPPDTVGIYVVANLVLEKSSSVGSPQVVLIQSPFERQSDSGSNSIPAGWTRDGINPGMAQIVKFGQNPEQKAFAILDDSLTGHAEWHPIREFAPVVAPGEQLVVEWNEMYSMGIGGLHEAIYQSLPTGIYHFHVAGLNIMGIPTGAEDSLTIIVPQPFWKASWFLGGLLISIFIVVGGSWRYVALQKMQREMLYLKNQQALERERLRIAHDIHDDLGARVTQISLLSAMCQDNSDFSEKARINFNKISQMSRELVAALYQTVWAVNPDNDNLDALGNYLCQMVTQLCDRVHFRCRFHVLDLPVDVQISSQARHNLTMAVKEAVHNIIKHAKASEVVISVEFTKGLLKIIVHDDGCGFEPVANSAGNGLTNMRQRLDDIGGSCLIESHIGQGTTICMRVMINPPDMSSVK